MQDKGKIYSRQKHNLAIISICLTPLILFLFILLQLPTHLKNLSYLISSNDYISLIIFIVSISVFYYILTLPLEYYSNFILEHKFSLSNQTFSGWIKREIKKNLISFVIGTAIVLAIWTFLKLDPLNWWLWTALLWFFISVILAKFAPIIIVPIFYKYSPIKNPELKNRLVSLVSKVGFKASEVYELNISKDTKKANAALLGMGQQKRIVLCDTLTANFTHEEIESVIAHELGHHKMHHILKIILFSAIFTAVIFFLTNIIFLKLHGFFGYLMLYDYESLVLIFVIISILNIFALPIHNVILRGLEKMADMFALKITGDQDAFIAAMKKLAKQNLSDIEPNKFYKIMLYDHPPIIERIAFAESYANKSLSKKT